MAATHAHSKRWTIYVSRRGIGKKSASNNDMRQSRHQIAVSAAVALLLVLAAAVAVPAARAQEETENEEEFSYIPGAKNGPENWGTIKGWEKCGTGRMQSPIALSDDHISIESSLDYLNQSYRPAEATIVNRGHDIMVRFDGDAGSLTINGTAYPLRQLHWHTPSEHTVNGRRYDMELHLVHQTAENKTAVIGTLFVVGRRDGFLRKLEPFLRQIADQKDREEPLGVVDPRAARPGGCAYYRYMGSLTTPPCTEDVTWTVVRNVRTVSKHQLQLLREAAHDGMENNARPLQALNNRDISLFLPIPRSPQTQSSYPQLLLNDASDADMDSFN